MATRTFEFCSLHYLNQWILRDSGYCEALANGSEDEKLNALYKAAAFYRISRNLPLAADENIGLPRYKPLLDVLDSVRPSDFKANVIQGIREVESAISKKYRDKGVLSLTTKVLWLKLKRPIIIYDARARQAIGTKDRDLHRYYSEWRRAFKRHSEQIVAACGKLVTMSKYTIDEDIATPRYIKDITAEPWFHERVFDVYLWNRGGDS